MASPYRCPECKGETAFTVYAVVAVSVVVKTGRLFATAGGLPLIPELSDRGECCWGPSDGGGWDRDSVMKCVRCKHESTVRNFLPENQ